MKTMKEYYKPIAKYHLTDKYEFRFLLIGLCINLSLLFVSISIFHSHNFYKPIIDLESIIGFLSLIIIGILVTDTAFSFVIPLEHQTFMGNFLIKRKINSKKFNEELNDKVEKYTLPFEINDVIVMKPEFIDFEEEDAKKYQIVNVKENLNNDDEDDITFLLKEIDKDEYKKVDLWDLFYDYQKAN